MRIFEGTSGLNTVQDPARLQQNEMAVAVNVDVDDTGRPGRRKGFTKVVDGFCHSIFCDGGECIFVEGDALCVLHSDYSYTKIRNLTVGARLRTCQVNDEIYYTNGHEQGIVRDSVSRAWVLGTYVGHRTNRKFSEPPIGTILEYYNGRMYIAQGNAVWFSEPYYLSAFDLTRGGLSFPTQVQMVRAVDDGLYISDERMTYFVAGSDPESFAEQKEVASYPAIAHTDGLTFGTVGFSKTGVPYIMDGRNKLALWLSEQGICAGGPTGSFVNLTIDKVHLPPGLSGAGLIHNKKYIGLINP